MHEHLWGRGLLLLTARRALCVLQLRSPREAPCGRCAPQAGSCRRPQLLLRQPGSQVRGKQPGLAPKASSCAEKATESGGRGGAAAARCELPLQRPGKSGGGADLSPPAAPARPEGKPKLSLPSPKIAPARGFVPVVCAKPPVHRLVLPSPLLLFSPVLDLSHGAAPVSAETPKVPAAVVASGGVQPALSHHGLLLPCAQLPAVCSGPLLQPPAPVRGQNKREESAGLGGKGKAAEAACRGWGC